MKSDNKKTFNKRSIVSITLFILFILLPISGKMIEIMGNNPEAKYIWGGIHYLLGLLFTIFGIFHIIYNWEMLKQYIKKK
jgi:hypothetical protein